MAESEDREEKGLEARVRDVVEEVIQGRNLFVVDVQVRGRKGSRAVDVYLDSEDELGIDQLARISRDVGFVLETEDVIPGRYNLNVSSPGADRPLTHPGQFRKHIGRPLRIERKSTDGETPDVLVGDLLEVREDGLVLSSGPSETVRIDYTDIETARVQLPW